MFRAVRIFGLLALVLLASAGTSPATETLKWDNLAPPWDDSENPIPKLPDEIQTLVYDILWGPNYGEASGKRSKEELAAYEKLKAAGIDTDKLFKKIEKIRDDLDKRDNTLLPSLNKKTIRLPGYVLPLDFDGKQVKSFLLVPSVGACIHSPAPPPNQIVHVLPDKPFTSEELYAPVWVTGQVRVGLGKKKLSFVDGSDDIDFGYSISGAKIEPYVRPESRLGR